MPQPIHSNYINIDGVKIHYLSSGKGPPFVIFHALFSDAETFRGLIECLSDQFTVFVPDFPGFGRSENLPKGSNFEADNALMCRWVKEMDLKNFILAGFSLGGLNIIQGISYLDTKVKKYILIEPYFNMNALKMDPTFTKRVQKYVRLVKRVIPPALGQKIWDSDFCLKILFNTIDPLKHEKRSLKDKIKNLRTANFPTFMYYLDLVMNLKKPFTFQKSSKGATLIMSRYDSTLDFAVTYEGYSHYFESIREIRVDLIEHYPTEPLTAHYFKTHFPTLIDEMLQLSSQKKRYGYPQ